MAAASSLSPSVPPHPPSATPPATPNASAVLRTTPTLSVTPSARAAAVSGLLAALSSAASGMAYASHALRALPPPALKAIQSAGGCGAFVGAFLHRRLRFFSLHGGDEDVSVLAPASAAAEDVLAFLSLPPAAAALHDDALHAAHQAALLELQQDGRSTEAPPPLATQLSSARTAAAQPRPPPSLNMAPPSLRRESAPSSPSQRHQHNQFTPSRLSRASSSSERLLPPRNSGGRLRTPSPVRPPSPHAVAEELMRVLSDVGGSCDMTEAFETLYRRMPAARTVVRQQALADADADTASSAQGTSDLGPADHADAATMALAFTRRYGRKDLDVLMSSAGADDAPMLRLRRRGKDQDPASLSSRRTSEHGSSSSGAAQQVALRARLAQDEAAEATEATVVESLVRVLRRQGGRCEVDRLFALVERRLPGTAALVRRAGGVPVFISRFPGHFEVLPAVPGGATIVRLSAPAAAAAILMANDSTPGSTPAATPLATPARLGAGTPVSAADGTVAYVAADEEAETVATLARILREYSGVCSASALFSQLYAELPMARAVVTALGRSRNFIERHAGLFVFDDSGKAGVVRLVGASSIFAVRPADAAAGTADGASVAATMGGGSGRGGGGGFGGAGAGDAALAYSPASVRSRLQLTRQQHPQHPPTHRHPRQAGKGPAARTSPMGSTVSAPAGVLPSEEAIVQELSSLLRDAGGERGAPQLFSQLYPRLRGSREVINMAGKTRNFLARHAEIFEWVANGAGGVVRLQLQQETPTATKAGAADMGAPDATTTPPTWGDQAEEDELRHAAARYDARGGRRSRHVPPDVRMLVPPSKAGADVVTSAERILAVAVPADVARRGSTDHARQALSVTSGATEHPSHDRTRRWVSAMIFTPPDHVECLSPAASAPSCPSPAPSTASSIPPSARVAEARKVALAAAESVAAASAVAEALRKAGGGARAQAQPAAHADVPSPFQPPASAEQEGSAGVDHAHEGQWLADMSTRGQAAGSPPALPNGAPEYPPGCWSPFNPNGARVYSLPFLMRFREACAHLVLDDPLLRSMQAANRDTAAHSQRGWAYSSYHGGLARFQQAPPMASLSFSNGVGAHKRASPSGTRAMGTRDFLQNNDSRASLQRLTPAGWQQAGATWQGLPESQLLLATFAVRSAYLDGGSPSSTSLSALADALHRLSDIDVSNEALRGFIERYGSRVGCRLAEDGLRLEPLVASRAGSSSIKAESSGNSSLLRRSGGSAVLPDNAALRPGSSNPPTPPATPPADDSNAAVSASA